MGEYSDAFDWQQFPEGRARFAGGVRGWDERGHDTFAVDIDGEVVYGEIARAFLSNHNDFNVQVVSFGYSVREEVGMPIDFGAGPAQDTFPLEYLQRVQALVVQLLRAGLHFEDSPVVLTDFPNGHFQGKVIFPKGWAVGAGVREVVL